MWDKYGGKKHREKTSAYVLHELRAVLLKEHVAHNGCSSGDATDDGTFDEAPNSECGHGGVDV